MVFAVTNTPSDGDVLTASDYNENFTDIEDEINGETITSTKPWIRTKTSGSVTVNNDTTAFDVDFVDVSFTASELGVGDIITIFLWGVSNDSGGNVLYQFNINDVTSPTAVTSANSALTTTAQTGGFAEVRLLQDSSVDNQKIIFTFLSAATQAAAFTFESKMSAATGDANVFATAWTLRINLRYNTGVTNDSTIRYLVDIRKA